MSRCANNVMRPAVRHRDIGGCDIGCCVRELRPGRPQLDAFFAPYNELLRELVPPDFHWSDATHAHARRLSQM